MEAKSEITIKFSGSLPTAKPAPNKKVEIELTDQMALVHFLKPLKQYWLVVTWL